MNSRLRRSFFMTTLVALVLGVSGAAAPGNPTHTKVAGIDVDATTIPQLQRLMNRHRLSSQQLVRF